MKSETKQKILEWIVIIGMSSFGTITTLIALLAERPEVQNLIRGLTQM